jgi:serine kinase of HPr protein (carbohydrate metabolism regulator)
MILHAGCVARMTGGRWRGVLLLGPSGVGKSDLALRLLDRGWSLVADDRVRLWALGGTLYGAAPSPLAGLVEARGLGVASVRSRAFAAVDLLVDCLAPGADLERIPDPRTRTVERVMLPAVSLRPFEASAPAKLELALARAAGRF